MLEFYYDFLDRYIDRRDFELIQMNTIYADRLENAVRPEFPAEFEATEKWWFTWEKAMRRQPVHCAMLEATTSLNKTEKKKKFRTKGAVAQRQR